jgi:HAD superfamily hydrolase (TIGR01544 family)
MLENIIIPDEKKLEKLKRKIFRDGKEKFHVVADFDRTLTKAFVNGQKASTVIAKIRNGKYLTPDYAPEAHRLFDVYHPVEINPDIPAEEKNAKMQEWWKLHFELLIRCGLTKQLMHEIVRKRELRFRKGTFELIDYLHENNIPLIIMSAGPGDMIEQYLRQEGRLYENVHVIANFLRFDKRGKAIGVYEPIIHSCNKHEIEIKKQAFYKGLNKRKNVLLLGDGLEDLGMIEGFPYEALIKIGYLNEEPEKNLEGFKKSFDAVILNDGGMDYVNGLVREMFGNS